MFGKERWRRLEAALYRAITGNRLGHASETVANALRAVQGIADGAGARPWQIVGVSRETWRRWNLPAGARNAQKPSASHEAGLLAVLRRARLSAAREAQLRLGRVTVVAKSNYEPGVVRTVGPQTLDWRGNDAIIDAYLARGIRAAADAFMAAVGEDHFKEWLQPENETSLSYDVVSISLTESPARGTATRSAGGRRQRRR